MEGLVRWHLSQYRSIEDDYHYGEFVSIFAQLLLLTVSTLHDSDAQTIVIPTVP
jgi:hypothetical protein